MVGTMDHARDLQYETDKYESPDQRGMSESPMGLRNPENPTPDFFKDLAKECYESSTNWLNAGRRLKWAESLRAFQNLHATNSKYLSTDYRYRSRLFRPKTRTMVRKGEASTAAAFFANEQVVNIQAGDDDDKTQQASAEIMQRLLQYRLTKTIPWFLTLVGARQDCEVMGICIGKAFWKYRESYSHTIQKPKIDSLTGLPHVDPESNEPIMDEYDVFSKDTDHPWVDLIAPENFRFDPGADWRDPIATSPYLIEMVPMYVADVKALIDSGEWLPVSDGALMGSTDLDDDVTRRSREQGRVPGKDHDAWKPKRFDICWVRENIIRIGADDWHFFTIAATGQLLSLPKPLREVYLHGVRPYACGFIVPEAHKVYPSSKVELVKDLQTQANDVMNLRLDNVKLALNPRQFVAEGKNYEPQDLRTFMPGKVVFGKSPKDDIVWDRPPEVTASAYGEQDRIDLDFDGLTGETSNSSIQANRQIYEAVGNMEMMQGNANTIIEYEQRVFAETFVEKIIRQLVLLEQAYETDPVVLEAAGREARIFQRFGMTEITDELLRQELTVRVNVGLGATDPKTRLANFGTAAATLEKIFGQALAVAANPEEIIKEVFGACGFKDGKRFFVPDIDIHQLMVIAAQAKMQPKGHEQQQPNQGDPTRVQAAQIAAQGKIREREIQAQTDYQTGQMDLQREMFVQSEETRRAMLDAQREFATDHLDRQHEAMQSHIQNQMRHQMPPVTSSVPRGGR